MDIFANIVSRRSIAKVTDEPVSKQLVERIIEAGTFAPTHKRTDPWRFLIFEGKGRDALSKIMAQGFKRDKPDTTPEKLEIIAGHPYRAPTIILVWCAVGRCKKQPPVWEEYAAVSACLQNMSLAAHGFGLGSIWRSGSLTEYPELQALCKGEDGDDFNAELGDKVIGLLYLGHIDCEHPEPARFPKKAIVKWFA